MNSIAKMTKPKEILKSLNKKIITSSGRTIETAGLIIQSIFTNENEKIKEQCIKGIPDDCPMLRALIWKINLGYLPNDFTKWEATLLEKRKKYHFLKAKIMGLKADDFNKKLYKYKDLLETITKDVNRTHIQFNFFYQPTQKDNKFTSQQLKEIYAERQNCSMSTLEKIYKLDVIETHAEVLERILFIFAKLTPDVLYRQGMNEIVSLIYYCYFYDKTLEEETEENIEADTFWSFYNLMKDLIVSYDDLNSFSSYKKAEILEKAFEIVDPVLSLHFKEIGLKFTYFCNKWFLLLFSQDYNVTDILRLWDLFFMEENNKSFYVFYAGIAIIEIKRNKLMNLPLAESMMEIQNVAEIEVDVLVKKIILLKNEFDKKIGKMFAPPTE